MFAVSIIIFSTVAMLPGDFAQAILGQAATPETVAAFDRQIGLDRWVALKMVLGGGHAGRSALERFHVEAKAVARLHHWRGTTKPSAA